MGDRYDGVVLGAGHHGLIVQAYLARAGLRVVSIDRASVPGGGLTTIENERLPGFFHNTHSFFHRGITAMPWYRDLELARHGAEYVEPELNVAVLCEDGRTLEWWRDPKMTLASVARFSPNDARTLRSWIEEFRPIVEDILLPEASSPPPPEEDRRRLLEASAAGRRLLEVSALSPLEFVEREFESEVVRAGLLFFNGLREVDPNLRGFGHAVPALLASGRMAQMCRGGAAALARALVNDIEEHGGEVLCGVEPRNIVLRDGRASAVELANGRVLEATRFVASSLSPRQTFIELLDQAETPGDTRLAAERFRFNRLAPLFALDVALREPPRYRAFETHPELKRAFMIVLGAERLETFREILRAHERGDIPPAIAWGATPTLFDTSQAPSGRHTAFLWQKVPYRLQGDPSSWETEGPGHAERLLAFWRRHASNLDERNILDLVWRAPPDTVRRLPNLAEADLLGGSFDHGQLRRGRPFPEAGSYRTPLPGLYLCSATHPGGNITGLCGYNAAGVIARDLGIETRWSAN